MAAGSKSNYRKMLSILKTIFFKLYLNFIGAVYLVKENVIRPRKLGDYPSQAGRTVVITGGGRGIGEEAVKKFLRQGLRVIVGCRSPDKVKASLDQEISDGQLAGSVECLHLDLSSQASVRKFAQSVISLNTPVHVLANNAGIMFGPRKVTEDGWEGQLATNYLGHFLLTHLLLPQLASSGDARVVSVSSCASYMGSWLDWADWSSLARFYSPEQAYGNSKAAQILFTQQLSRLLEQRNSNVRCYTIHPGIVYTGLYVNVWWMKPFSLVARLVMKTPEQGGDTLVHAVLAPELPGQGGGLHLENHRPARISSFCQSKLNQEKLWSNTCALLQIENFGSGQ